MRHIKLDATESTNDYLRELIRRENTPSFTVVSTKNQTAGRGQMGASWIVAKGKNLTFSVFVSDFVRKDNLFDLNAAVAIALVESVETFGIPDLKIKWPNDIMSGRNKIGGILIESVFRADGVVDSIIGIGLNVNQKDFDGLPQAGSMSSCSGTDFDRDEVLQVVLAALQSRICSISHDHSGIWAVYHNLLFKKEKPLVFETSDGFRFSGMIREVTTSGKLRVETESEEIREFGIREVKMLF